MHRLQIQYTAANARFFHWYNGAYSPERLFTCNGVFFVGLFQSRTNLLEFVNFYIPEIKPAICDIDLDILKPILAVNFPEAQQDTYIIKGIDIDITITTHPELNHYKHNA